jgi:uncharacterized protein
MACFICRRGAFALVAATLAFALAPQSARAQLMSFPDWYTLADAAANNKAGAVAYLLRRGDNPNLVDSVGHSPLDYAATFGNIEMLRLLLEGGARPDYRDSFGSTALHWAAERGQVEAINMLVAAKAPVDAQNKQGITPLMLAAGADKPAAVKALLKAGADPTKQDFTGRDARGWALGHAAALQALEAAKTG